MEAPQILSGTAIAMEVDPQTKRTTKEIFDKFTTDLEEYGFDRTVVPIFLAKAGEDQLVSRSQAKRVLARVERFKEVVLNFNDVESIGQAFADEIFRVFANQHPEVHLQVINASQDVHRMINRAKAARDEMGGQAE